jgi:hypothetical protein
MHLFTKTIFALLLVAGFSGNSFSQDFILLAEDPENDEISNGNEDLKAVYYALDEANDSLWFKIEYYNGDVTGDMGLVFGIDTNLVADDGLTWDGGNQSLQPDVIFTINHVFFSAPFYGFSNHDFHYQTRVGDDTKEIIVNIKYSELDGDGKFNLLLGAAFFSVDADSRQTYDQLPNNVLGFIAFPPAPNSNSEVAEPLAPLQISPNPAGDFFELKMPESGQLMVSDVNGKTVFMGDYKPGSPLDCSQWPTGWYSLMLTTANSRFSGRVFVH